ncbi:cytochrome-c peroxidase [Myxococcus landrumensis]|uniref:Cytochrome c domain-containing protein n=1 Tax=Myxococcus landrumensis TaxID=2813577 RepID=A0ABX7NF11_9BACT|nr:cytochrome c peroxidase [Myxococcus landrumus]QSQ16974.1 hypothetical protein JY572_13365 [Myxococcus landrumus]
MLSLSACEPGGQAEPVKPAPVQQEELATDAQALLDLVALTSLRPLSHEPVPQPVGSRIINQAAAIRLGKAFFWDIQTSGDGQTACATCHFAAGADDRRVNTIHPGFDNTFNAVSGPGQTFTLAKITSDDRVGSAGPLRAQFLGLDPDPTVAADVCQVLPAAPFNNQRMVGARHSPSVVGSGFYRNQFWGGEANVLFNGWNIWGDSGNNEGGNILVRIENASLASQATGPVTNFTEQSCFGRTLWGADGLGAKLLVRQPLQHQRVSTTDSVLGDMANPNGPGLLCDGEPCTYDQMVREAFGDPMGNIAVHVFSLLWGEALQAYQATLIPDQTPFDRFLSGHLTALTPKQIKGLAVFVGKGECINCHTGAMLSDATVSWYETAGPLNRDGGDTGFHNIGVRPTDDDLARGDLGIFGGVPNSVSLSPFDMGAFKTPTLRNVGLNPPYFHNGGYPTLDDVVDFYARGGDFPNPEKSLDIVPRTFSTSERAALVDFLANALTDCRVATYRAPFDHPELPFPNRATLPVTGRAGVGHCR